MIVTFWICLIFTVLAIAEPDGENGCKSNPCQNDAKCLSQTVEDSNYFCICENGFSGKNCEVADNSSDASNDYISTSSSRAFTSETHKVSTKNSTEILSSTEGTTNNLRSSPSMPYTTSTDSSAATGFSTDKGSTSTIISETPKLTNYITRSATETTSKVDVNISSNRPSEELLQTSTAVCFPNPCYNGGMCLENVFGEQNYYCVCNKIYDGTHCEIAKTPAFEETTEVIQSTFNSSYSTTSSTTTATNKDVSKSTTIENKTSSTAVTSSMKTAAILEDGLVRNSTNFTESTEEFLTNVTTPFQELNNATTSTTQLVSFEVTQSTYFSVSSEQNTLSVNTTEKEEEITSNLTSTMKDTITPSPTTKGVDSTITPFPTTKEVDSTITPSPTTEEVTSTITPSLTTEEVESTVTLSDFFNTTRSMPVTGSNNKLPVAACVGIGVLSLILILILMGSIIYSKKYREKKRISLYANVLGEETSSISNGSNCSCA